MFSVSVRSPVDAGPRRARAVRHSCRLPSPKRLRLHLSPAVRSPIHPSFTPWHFYFESRPIGPILRAPAGSLAAAMAAAALASFSECANALGEHIVARSCFPCALCASPWPVGPYFVHAGEVPPPGMEVCHAGLPIDGRQLPSPFPISNLGRPD